VLLGSLDIRTLQGASIEEHKRGTTGVFLARVIQRFLLGAMVQTGRDAIYRVLI
jgi:hypothetical protein